MEILRKKEHFNEQRTISICGKYHPLKRPVVTSYPYFKTFCKPFFSPFFPSPETVTQKVGDKTVMT